MLGPYISASSKPTFLPEFAKLVAKLTAKVDLPTPPFPLAIAIMLSQSILKRLLALSLWGFFSAVSIIFTETHLLF